MLWEKQLAMQLGLPKEPQTGLQTDSQLVSRKVMLWEKQSATRLGWQTVQLKVLQKELPKVSRKAKPLAMKLG